MIKVVLQASSYKESFENRSFQMIQGVPVITYIIERLQREKDIDVVLAVSERQEDDIYVEVAKAKGVKIVRGSYENVIERMILAAQEISAEHIVRIYANYPLIDIKALRELYEDHIQGGYDYSYNEHSKGLLWGMGCEVFSVDMLQHINGMDLLQSQREAISFYLRQNESVFHINKKSICNERPGYKVYLETTKDLDVIREIVENIDDEIENDNVINYFEKHPILVQYNVEEPAKEVGLEKLFLHPEKIKSLLNCSLDETYPISVEMTLTNKCNLKCVYCSDDDLRTRQGREQSVALNVIERLFSDLSKGGTKGVVLEGGGEPTLSKDFSAIVNCAKQNNLGLGLITNGTVRLEPDIVKQFEWIRVSLDASTSKEYLDLKGVDCFERVISNIAHYAQYCGTVGVGYVVTSKNISELESLVMRLREAGVSYIQLRPVVDCDELYPYGVDLSYLKFYQSSRFAVIVDGMKENASSGNANLPCRAHSLTSIISGDGSVYLCGRLNIYSWLEPIGNINRESFHDIWLGEKRKKQSCDVADKEFCKQNCPQCRITKFNELLNRLNSTKSKHFI